PAGNGSVVVNGDGTFTYTPNADFNGTDTFSYEVTDGQETASATVTVNVAPVNDLPNLDVDGQDTGTISVDTTQGTATQPIPFTIMDVEDGQEIGNGVDNPALAMELVTPAAQMDGVVNFDEANGTFSFEPDAGFAGQTSFDVQAVDSEGGRSEIFTITVNVAGTTLDGGATPVLNGTPNADAFTANNENLNGASVDGNGGEDTVFHSVDNQSNTFNFSNFELQEIEHLNITADGDVSDQFDMAGAGPLFAGQDGSAVVATYDLSDTDNPVNGGPGTVLDSITVNNSTQDVALNASPGLSDLNIIDPTASHRVDYDVVNSVVSGGSDVLNIGLADSTGNANFGVDLNIDAAIETLNISTLMGNSQGFVLNNLGTGANALNINADDQSARWDLQIGGVTDTILPADPSALPVSATNVDAGASTGSLDLTLAANNVTLTLGDGSDLVRGGANLTAADTLTGGANGMAGVFQPTIPGQAAPTPYFNAGNAGAFMGDRLTLADDAGGPASLNNVTEFELVQLLDEGNDFVFTTGLNSAFAQDATEVTVDGSALVGNTLDFNAGNLTASGINLLGGDSDDSLTGGTQADNLIGNEGVDTLVGNSGDDVLDGGAGNDNLTGGIGDDLLIAGTGTDVLVGDGQPGANGDDRFLFNDGELDVTDTVSGGLNGVDGDRIEILANEPVNAATTTNVLGAGVTGVEEVRVTIDQNASPNDINITLDVGFAQSAITIDGSRLTSGAEQVVFTDEDNTNATDINFIGSNGNDQLFLNDTLDADDTIATGDGVDNIHVDPNSITDAAFAGFAADQAEILTFSNAGTLTLGTNFENAFSSTVNLNGGGNDTLDASAIGENMTVRIGDVDVSLDVNANGGDDADPDFPVVGNGGNDTVILGSGANRVETTDAALTAGDAIDGTAGLNDTIVMDNRQDAVVSTVNLNNVVGVENYEFSSDGDRSVLPDVDDNILTFQGGNIGTATGVSIDASMLTDADDSFLVDIQAGVDNNYEFNVTGSGTEDTVRVGNGQDNDIVFAGNAGDDTLEINANDLNSSEVEFDGGTGGSGQTVTAGQFQDNGGDALLVTGGNLVDDAFGTLTPTPTNEITNIEVVTFVGAGTATLGQLAGNSGLNTLVGGNGGDNLTFDAAFNAGGPVFINLENGGTDTVDASANGGAFHFFGNNDDFDGDVLAGGQGGNDQLYIGDGNDNGMAGATADLTNLTGVETITLLDDIFGDDSTTVVVDTLNTEVTGGMQTIDGSALGAGGADALTLMADGATADLNATGGAGDDEIRTGSGSDLIQGGAGADLIFGNGGNDVINGGNGDDQIIGGAGVDTLDGAAGDDDFLYRNVSDSSIGGMDTINGFVSGEDQVDIRFLNELLGSGRVIDFRGNTSDLAITDPEQALTTSPGTVEAVFDSANSTLWFDIDNDETLNADDISIVLDGVTSLQGVDVFDGFTAGQTNVAAGDNIMGSPFDDVFTLVGGGFNGNPATINGLQGNDTVVIDGQDISNSTLNSVETAQVNTSASMTVAQHNGFDEIDEDGDAAGETINVTDAGMLTGDADIAQYNLDTGVAGGNSDFTLGANGQSVDAGDGNDTIRSGDMLDTLTGTINGGAGNDELVLDANDNVSGATVLGIEQTTITQSSVTMTAEQHGDVNGNGTLGTIVDAGDVAPNSTDTITLVDSTLTAAGTFPGMGITGVADIEQYNLSAGNDQFTLGAVGQSVDTGNGVNEIVTGGIDDVDGTLGGIGTDTLTTDMGDDISDADVSAVENVAINGNVTMTVAQHNAFGDITTPAFGETITTIDGGTLTGDADVENYVLNSLTGPTAVDFTLGALGQNVTLEVGGVTADTVNFGVGAYTSEINNVFSILADTFTVVDETELQGIDVDSGGVGVSLGGAILDFQDLGHTTGVTLTTGQNNDVFINSMVVNAAGAQIINIAGNGTTNGLDGVETYNLADGGANTFVVNANETGVDVNGGDMMDTIDVGGNIVDGDYTLVAAHGDVVTAANGADVSGVNGGMALGADSLTINGAGPNSITMSDNQHVALEGLGGINAGAVNDTVVITDPGADGFTVFAEDAVENYVLAGGNGNDITFDGADGVRADQAVDLSGSAGDDTVTVENGGVDAAFDSSVTVSGFSAGAANGDVLEIDGADADVAMQSMTQGANVNSDGSNVIEIEALPGHNLTTTDVADGGAVESYIADAIGNLASEEFQVIVYESDAADADAAVYSVSSTAAGGDALTGNIEVEFVALIENVGVNAIEDGDVTAI
ncbi:Ig-like domain-containing protein, partial [Algiphilus sp.]|uniref:cadherin-like domain-containing protein n=1 Tax=Algiphilus sp. TaxID=1872431 RepID=UPI0025C29BA5